MYMDDGWKEEGESIPRARRLFFLTLRDHIKVSACMMHHGNRTDIYLLIYRSQHIIDLDLFKAKLLKQNEHVTP